VPATPSPNNPDASCLYCRVRSVGTPDADNLVCECDVFCGAGRCTHAPDNQTSTSASAVIRATAAGSSAPTAPYEDPYGEPLSDPGLDMAQRWLPHPVAVGHAKALLKADGAADFAVVPLFQPGKVEHIWWCGQLVHTVFGVVLLSVNTSEPTGNIPSHAWVRNTASTIAAARLRTYAERNPDVRGPDGEIGTTAYAVVRRDGGIAVFEDGPPDERHILN
jgi:hypothetical protein